MKQILKLILILFTLSALAQSGGCVIPKTTSGTLVAGSSCTVDNNSLFFIRTTTAGLTFTIPTPSAGKYPELKIFNDSISGSVTFSIPQGVVQVGKCITIRWSGTAWETQANSGSVRLIAVPTTNGIGAIITNPSTAPSLAFFLTNIVPTTVNGIVFAGTSTPVVNVTGTVNISGNHSGNSSGTNTGDQTNISGNAATVTTNANLTGPITSVGNATAIASQTGTGNTFVMSSGPIVTGNMIAEDKLLVGDTDPSFLSASDVAIVGSGNSSATNALSIYNSDDAPIFRTRNDGGFIFYESLYNSNGNKRWDIANNLIYANDGTSDRIDIQNAACYYGGTIQLDWKNKLLSDGWNIGAATATNINGVTVTNGGAGALTVNGTAAVGGTNTGDQTNISGNAATVTTNANLTGPITSSGNATSVAAQTGTGTTFVMNTDPTVATPTLTGTTTLSGNVTAPAWIGNGIGLIQNAATYTDNSSSGAVGVVVINKINAPTYATVSNTTPTAIATTRISAPLRGANILGSGTLYGLIIDGEAWCTAGLLVGGSVVVTTNLTVSGSTRFAYVAKTGTYSIATTDNTIECTTGTFTVTLPTAVSVAGRFYTVKNSGAGVVTVATTSSQTIDGAATLSVIATKCYTVMSNGANWIITSTY